MYRIQAEDNPRKRKVVHFNRLKLCGARKPVISSGDLIRLLAPSLTRQFEVRMLHRRMFLTK